jgi:protein-tyrosine-phosphatase
MRRGVRSPSLVLWALAFGYFAFYVPYSALAKALTDGLLPGVPPPTGLVILPAAALGSALAMPLFLLATGWWREGSGRPWRRMWLPRPSGWALASALATAVVIGTTTFNYTFAGVSIVLVLLLMRGGVLTIAPLVDLARRRRVTGYSWLALALSLVAVALALAGAGRGRLETAALVSLGLYFAGYVARFLIISGRAKVADGAVNRAFFVDEHMAATPMLVLLLAAAALAGPALGLAATAAELRLGFTTFLTTPAAPWALAIGVLYEGLFVFGSLIYLDRRELTYCVPVNRGSSLLAGLVASLLLVALYGQPPPAASSLVGLAIVLAALAVLAVGPTLERRRAAARAGGTLPQGLFLFVCGGNTARSPMAAAICRAQVAARLGLTPEQLAAAGCELISAGVTALPGGGADPEADSALTGLGFPAPPHRTRPLTAELVRRSRAVFCMTAAQCAAVAALAPEAAARVVRLDPAADLDDPHGRGAAAYLECARRLRELTLARFDLCVAGSSR